jgi:hypothetical protein
MALTSLSRVLEHLRTGLPLAPDISPWQGNFRSSARTLFYALSWLKIRSDYEAMSRTSERQDLAALTTARKILVGVAENLCALAEEADQIRANPETHWELERMWTAIAAAGGRRRKSAMSTRRRGRAGHRE